MAIDTEKILKISDKDYFNLTGEDSSDYMLKKIKIDVGRPNYVMATFANNVPSEAINRDIKILILYVLLEWLLFQRWRRNKLGF